MWNSREETQIAQILQLLALQIITHHGYDDVRIVILTKEEGLYKWNFLKHLPHVWNDNFTTRYFLCGKAMSHIVLSELYDLFKTRELNSQRINPIPHYVFIVEDNELLENEQISKYIYEPNGKIGVSSIFTAMNQAYLPMNCKTVINLSSKKGDIANRETGEKNSFIIDSLDIKSLENGNETCTYSHEFKVILLFQHPLL